MGLEPETWESTDEGKVRQVARYHVGQMRQSHHNRKARLNQHPGQHPGSSSPSYYFSLSKGIPFPPKPVFLNPSHFVDWKNISADR